MTSQELYTFIVANEITQEKMAHYLGVTVGTLNRVFTQNKPSRRLKCRIDLFGEELAQQGKQVVIPKIRVATYTHQN